MDDPEVQGARPPIHGDGLRPRGATARPAVPAGATFAPATPISGVGDEPALAQVSGAALTGCRPVGARAATTGVFAAVAEPAVAFTAPQLLADAQTATLPQGTAVAIEPGAALVACVGPGGGWVTRATG